MNLNPTIPGAPVEVLLFAGLAALAIIGALSVIIASDPFVSALSLLGNFASLGVLYMMVNAPFVAIAQVIVYAGAVVVLFLFVIAYLGDRREIYSEASRHRWERPVAGLTAAALAAVLAISVVRAEYREPAELAATKAGFAFGSAQAIGEAFMTTFLLHFEMTSLVLLVAAIGGIVLGLTGRERHRRMRDLMGTRSADQQRLHASDQRRAEHGLAPRGTRARQGAPAGVAGTSSDASSFETGTPDTEGGR